jgi:hypothetical protein
MGLIASKLAPTGVSAVHKSFVHNRSHVGASLLAMTMAQSQKMLTPGTTPKPPIQPDQHQRNNNKPNQ